MFLDSLVLGSNLAAVIHAHVKKEPLILSADFRPFIFDNLPTPVRLNGNVFRYELELWSYLIFKLSLSGQILFNENVRSVVFYPDRKLSVYLKSGGTLSVTYENVTIFDCANLSGEIEFESESDNAVYDWMHCVRGGRHTLDEIELEDSFIDRVIFYPSDRPDVHSATRDLVAVSYQSDEQLLSFDYSDTMTRFLIEKEMNSLGIKVKNGSAGYRGPAIEPIYREVVRRNRYRMDSTDCVNFVGPEDGLLIGELDGQ